MGLNKSSCPPLQPLSDSTQELVPFKDLTGQSCGSQTASQLALSCSTNKITGSGLPIKKGVLVSLILLLYENNV